MAIRRNPDGSITVGIIREEGKPPKAAPPPAEDKATVTEPKKKSKK